MRFCPIEHQFIQKSFHRQINDSNKVFGYSFRGWEPARLLWNLLEYFISIVDFAERQLEDMVIWAKALLSHECQLPLFPSYHWGTLLYIPLGFVMAQHWFCLKIKLLVCPIGQITINYNLIELNMKQCVEEGILKEMRGDGRREKNKIHKRNRGWGGEGVTVR